MMKRQQQQGFSIVTAIFLIVILAALGTYMLRISAVQSESVSLSIQTARVYQAAQSGLEWGLHQAIQNNSCVPGPTVFTLQAFTVSVTCQPTNHPIQGGNFYRVYQIASTARFGSLANQTYVQRVVEARASELCTPAC